MPYDFFSSGKLNIKYTGCYTNVTGTLILEKKIFRGKDCICIGLLESALGS